MQKADEESCDLLSTSLVTWVFDIVETFINKYVSVVICFQLL